MPRDLSLDGLIRYLAFEYVPAPHSILAGVAKLPPGHVATVSIPDLEVEVARYWDLAFKPDYSLGEAEWADRLRWQLEAAIRRRLVSDVPLGFFLSGGLDSSSVVALAARTGGGRPLRTFSLGFEEPGYDERPFARATAEHCGTLHTEAVFGPGDALALLDRAGDLLDEPLVDGSLLPIHVLSEVARRDVTVVLSGDGPDELLCGYPTFLADQGSRWAQRLPGAIVALLRRAVQGLPTSGRYGSVESLLKQFFRGLAHPPEVRTQLLLGGLTALERTALLSEPVLAACARLDPYEEMVRTVGAPRGLNSIDRLVYQHCKFYLPDQNLTTVDRASMSCGLEVRAPFLDHALVELIGQIPVYLKLRGWRTKHILKRAVQDVLPPVILHRRKQGFSVPIGAWLRGALRGTLEERLAVGRVGRRGLFDPTTVERLVSEHVAGRRDHRKILWGLLMFDAWCERYLPRAAFA